MNHSANLRVTSLRRRVHGKVLKIQFYTTICLRNHMVVMVVLGEIKQSL